MPSAPGANGGMPNLQKYINSFNKKELNKWLLEKTIK